jgi:hypothetical protein
MPVAFVLLLQILNAQMAVGVGWEFLNANWGM